MKKKKKGIAGKIILVVVLLLLAAGGFLIWQSVNAMKNMAMVEPMELKKKDLRNTVTFSGIVESNTFEQVTSGMNLPIATVNVKEGDIVKKGDILATLDSDTIEDDILQQQANLDSKSLSSGYVVSDAERQYMDTAAQIENGTYAEIYSARVSLDNAKTKLERAREDYERQLSTAGSDKDSSFVSASASVESAKTELSYAEEDLARAKRERENEDYVSIRAQKKAYDEAKKEYDERFDKKNRDEVQAARDEYEQAQENYSYIMNSRANGGSNFTDADAEAAAKEVKTAKSNLEAVEKKYDVKTKVETYDDALIAYTDAKAKIDSNHDLAVINAERAVARAKTALDNAQNQVKGVITGNDTKNDTYAQAVTDAQKAVDQAEEAYDLAVKRANNTLSELKAAADKQRVLSNDNSSQLISIEILKERLDKCVITALCDGTITQSNAIVGGSSQGILFIIEDTSDLKFVSAVKEYSVGNLTKDEDVTVNIPALYKDFPGKISHVSAAGTKGTDGKSDGNATFSVSTDIKDTDENVLIGMTAKGTVITDEVKDVYAVSYDCVAETDGKSHICEAVYSDETKTYTVKFVEVTTGFEANAEVEIKSSELHDGMLILPNAADYTEGQMVMNPNAIMSSAAANNSAAETTASAE
ncbi:MAG: biotin/lipoyl-binding protein [Oscillospiraceae bacterium]|nr:biotin/lipoyl-binding protein [Oscillospiraceae bacterium]